MAGIAEVQLGRLATQKASDPRVRQFGQHMIDDHLKINASLRSAASRAGIGLPGDVGGRQKKLFDRLSHLSGSAFDRAYMDAMVRNHKEDVASFTKAVRAREDSPIRRFAEDALPVLQDHLQMAEATRSELKVATR